MRSLDAKAERLPERFVNLLGRALAHYGVEGLDRTPALEEACYRLFVSHERADLARAAVMAILEKRLERADELVGNVDAEFRGVLDRLELATERRDPVIADLARQLRNRYFDQPLIAERQAAAYEVVERAPARRCSRTRTAPTAPSTSPRWSTRRSCWRRRSSSGCRPATAREHPVLLEIMTRRWYRTARADGLLGRRHPRRHRVHHDELRGPGAPSPPRGGVRRHAGPRRHRRRDRAPRGRLPAGRVGVPGPLRGGDRGRGAGR